MKLGKKTVMIIALIIAVMLISAALAVFAFANTGSTTDAMIDIERELSSYKIGSTITVDNDGYIGIPVKVSNYYDTSKGATKPGYNGTPLIVYVVNTRTERIGKKTDVAIITSLLNRGYIVQIFDYMNNSKAVSPDLDWSTQTLRQNSKKGTYFKDNTYLKAGTYYDTILLPAGYDVSLNNVFWETDKHGADGDLEKIVENWNTDFRSWFKDTVIYWRTSEGAQKETQNGFDGSKPVWYSDAEAKNVVNDSNSADAKYIKVQYTKATDITDCVGKDGTPIDLNLYMHVIYPTNDELNPLKDVPVIALANSAEYLSDGLNTADRPQMSGFMFNGYAGVVFDYLYQPMAQSDYYGYYDGRTSLGAITGDHMNYGLHLYDDKRINTAAMRYIRYLTLTNPEEYRFDIDSIGVYGNSKGGWFTFLGEAELKNNTTVPSGKTLAEAMDARINAYTSKRTYEGTRGETRYQNGDTADYKKNGVIIEGGELQPWLTYKDKNDVEHEIKSYASWIYASVGSQFEDITKGHAPVFSALQIRDDITVTHNAFAESTRNLDVPSIYVIVDNGHTFAYGPDYYYGFDTYQAMFDFAHYYLKNSAVKVIYTDPAGNTGRLDTTPSITVKFTGEVPLSEIEKITLVGGSHTATGTWTSVRGNTEWTFLPDALLPGTKYVLTVPANLMGKNGVAMGAAYTTTFVTESEDVSNVTVTNGARGSYFTLTVPSVASSDAKIRFHVANDAANIAELYAVSGFNAASPDSSTKGSLVGSVNLFGAGYYEIDVTKYVSEANAGSSLTFLLSAKKESKVLENKILFASSSTISGITYGSFVRASSAKAPDGTSATKLYVTANKYSNGNLQYPNERMFYVNTSTGLNASNFFGSTLTKSDLGRKYHVTIRLYDTDRRVVQLSLNRVKGDFVHDQHSVYYNFMTTPGEWQEFSFDYTVYEPIYGDVGLVPKTLTMMLGHTGNDESPIYVDYIYVTETVTDIELASDAAALVLGDRGADYKKNGTAKAFTIGSVGYDSFKAALSAAKSGETVVMNRNYTFTDSDDFTGWGALEKITLNLNGYKLYSNSKSSIIHASAKSVAVPKTTINIIGGEIYLSSAALIGYKGSSVSGDGKSFNINIDGTTILNAEGSTLTAFITENSIESGAGVDVKINLNNVNIDLTKRINTRNPVAIFANGSADLSVTYEICGGSIYVDDFAGNTFFGDFRKAKFTKTADGSYTTLLTGTGTSVPTISAVTETTIVSYKLLSSSNNIATYTLKVDPLATKYGLIPEQYANADNYPFIMFDENGNFKGAYDRWLGDNGAGSVLGAARNYVVNAWNGTSYGVKPKEAFIVMRHDYTFDASKDSHFDNLAHIQGTINIDLGGFTLANSSAVNGQGIFPANSKGLGEAAGDKIFPTTIRVTNGAIRTYHWGVVQASTWDSLGGGTIANKDFNFIFDKVTIGFVENPNAAGLILHRKTASSSVAAPFNLTFNDCIIDTTTKKTSHSCTIFKLNHDDKEQVKVNYVVNGGKIITDGVSTITLAEIKSDGSTTHGSTLVFGKGEDGNYTSYYIPENSNKTLAIGKWNSTDGKVLGFFANGTESSGDISYKRYTLDIDPLITEYGTIPDNYRDSTAYPFAVFYREGSGEYKYDSVHTTLKAAVSRAKSINSTNVWDTVNKTYGTSAKSSVVLFRRDYIATSADNYMDYGQNQGTILIDLNGFTLTQGSGSNSAFAEITAKGWSSSGDAYVFPSTFTVKNGKILVTDKPVIVADTWHSVVGNKEMAAKVFTWNFDSVEFGFVKNATAGTNLLVSYKNPQTSAGEVKIPFVFNYNGCTFDMTNAPSGAKLFDAATSTSTGKWIQSMITVKGGEIKAPSLTLAQLYSIDGTNTYGSSVQFVKDANGEYTKLYITNGGAAPSGDVPTDSGFMSFAKTVSDASETLYTLTSLNTPYGAIPADKASVEDYPFVVFDTDGKYHGAYQNLLGAQAGAMGTAIYTVLRDYNKWDETSGKYIPQKSDSGVKTAVILLRRDYTMTSSEYHNNLSHTQGTIIIDLGGYTIYSDNTRVNPVFDSMAKGWSDPDDGNLVFPSSFIVKNGAFRNHSSSVLQLICNDSLGGNAIAKKPISWTFENVTFGLMRGATVADPIIHIGDAKTATGVFPATVNFNDCTFDFESVAPAVETTVINAAFASKYYINGAITIRGGKLIANNMTNIKLYSLDTSRGSSITFEKGSDGKYFEVHLASGAAAPSFTYVCNTGSGETTLTYSAKENGKDIYTLQASIVTKHGNIPARFASVEKYPFAVFNNGKFVIATAIFGKDASESALHNSKSAGSVVLLRRDFTYAEDRYNNLSQTYSVIIDLGGFTFTMNSSDSMFYAQKKTAHDTTVKVINGTILTSGASIVKFDSWGANGKYTGGNNFDISFENINIGATEGASPAILIATAMRDIPQPLTYCSVTLKDCEINLEGIESTTLFDIADKSGILRVKAVICGGKIVSDSFDGITLGNVFDTYNSLLFKKNDGGEYTILYLKDGASAPSAPVSTLEGNLYFARTGTDGEFGIYKLSAADTLSFTPKISVTLYSDFIFNIYIPASQDVKSIEFDGETLDISKLEITKIDGKDFYTLHKPQSASSAAEDFTFRVGVLSGGKMVYGNWTVSIVRYAKLVLNDESSNNTEKALVSDMLSYVRSAYVYFKAPNAAEVKNEIDAVIGANYDSISKPTDMNASDVGDGFDAATFALDDAPAFVFYPETNENGTLVYSTDRYVFTLNGKELAKEVITRDDGTVSIKIKTYAYGICENIAYEISGTDISGEFNIKTYYEFAKTQNDESLVNIVERLWKYAESAKNYKLEVGSK